MAVWYMYVMYGRLVQIVVIFSFGMFGPRKIGQPRSRQATLSQIYVKILRVEVLNKVNSEKQSKLRTGLYEQESGQKNSPCL
jgi:hypothetical protein